jgi:hypothetical protein
MMVTINTGEDDAEDICDEQWTPQSARRESSRHGQQLSGSPYRSESVYGSDEQGIPIRGSIVMASMRIFQGLNIPVVKGRIFPVPGYTPQHHGEWSDGETFRMG